MENETEATVEATEETTEETSTEETNEESTTKEKPEETTQQEEKPKETPEERASRLLRQTNQARKKLGLPPLSEEKPKEKTEKRKETTSGLDETQLDYLDLKGITEKEDITIIESVINRTGQSLRDALKDDYVVSKLKANKDSRDIKDAMPGTGQRGAPTQNKDVAWWVAENERSGKLPDDFELRKKVVEAKERRFSNQTPPWKK